MQALSGKFRLDGEAARRARDSRVHGRKSCSGFEGASAPSGLATLAFGLAATGCSGLRAGDRPGFKGFPSGSSSGPGGMPVAVRGRGAFSEANRPAPETGFALQTRVSEGRCRSSFDPPFRQVGFPSPCREAADPGPRGFREETARRSHRPEPLPARVAPAAWKVPRKRRLSGDLDKTEGKLRAALRPGGAFGNRLAPGRALRLRGRLASRGNAKAGCRRDCRSATGPDQWVSLPSGRSANSLRLSVTPGPVSARERRPGTHPPL